MAVGAKPAWSNTTPSLPLAQLADARPHRQIMLNTSAMDWLPVSAASHFSPCPAHQVRQARMEVSSMRLSGRPTPASNRPSARTPFTNQRKMSAGLLVILFADHAVPFQVGTFCFTNADSRSILPCNCPLALIFNSSRVRPVASVVLAWKVRRAIQVTPRSVVRLAMRPLLSRAALRRTWMSHCLVASVNATSTVRRTGAVALLLSVTVPVGTAGSQGSSASAPCSRRWISISTSRCSPSPFFVLPKKVPTKSSSSRCASAPLVFASDQSPQSSPASGSANSPPAMVSTSPASSVAACPGNFFSCVASENELSKASPILSSLMSKSPTPKSNS